MNLKDKVIDEIKKIYDPEIPVNIYELGLPATARASFGVYNTKDDIDQLNNSINNCKKIFNLK